ncbi:hypothetical protein T484DRAFT_1752292 [Baffinella frigidus]|nr:hypothetical protein T484DRAFT_1752292 [Cryptophyta sp. CCMP2293]
MISASKPVQRPMSEIEKDESDLSSLAQAEHRLHDLGERRADAAHRLAQVVDWISRIEAQVSAGEGLREQLQDDMVGAHKQRVETEQEVDHLDREGDLEFELIEECKDRIQEAKARAVKGSVWMVSSLVPPRQQRLGEKEEDEKDHKDEKPKYFDGDEEDDDEEEEEEEPEEAKDETDVRKVAGGAGAGYRDGRTDFASFEGASGVEAAVFRHPRGIAADSGGNLFVADAENHCIRGISAQGQPSRQRLPVEMSGGPWQREKIWHISREPPPLPARVKCVADRESTEAATRAPSAVGRVASVSRVASGEGGGATGSDGGGGLRLPAPRRLCGVGMCGHRDGRAEFTELAYPAGVAVGAEGQVIVADHGNAAVRVCRLLREEEVKAKLRKMMQVNPQP